MVNTPRRGRARRSGGRRRGPRARAAPLDSRATLLAAAAVEFAARGFDGATVDRIARAARLNKAMIYYHFGSKLELYRAIALEAFQAASRAVGAVQALDANPLERLDAFIEAFSRELHARPHFGALWMREVAEGGRHVDDRVLRQMAAIPAIFAGIIAEGRNRRLFKPVNPIVAYLGVAAPLLLHTATGPLRRRLTRAGVSAAAAISEADMIDHVRRSLRGLLTRAQGGEDA